MTEGQRTVIEEWAAFAPELELWWDASPLVFDGWAAAQPDPAAAARLLPRDGLPVFRGVTTNPIISAAVLKADPDGWKTWIRTHAKERSLADPEPVYWATYLEIVRRGAERMRGLFGSSGMKYGFISGQVDPRNPFDEEKMFRQGMEISRVAPNVMVKVPGTKAGLGVLRRLTEQGIPTNVTVQFTVSQMMSCARVVQDAEAIGRKRGNDFSRWRSVLSFMPGRMEEQGTLEAEGKAAHADWSDDDRHWAGVAVYKRTWNLLRTGGFRSRILLCSMRTGPGDRCLHTDETCGDDQIITAQPAFLAWLANRPPVPWRNSMVEPVPDAAMKRLLALPYFREVYEDGSQAPDRFDTFAPTVRTCADFSKATGEMVAFVRAAL